MKKLMYISPEYEAVNLLKMEIGDKLIYSESHGGFICFEDYYNILDEKFHFKQLDEDGYERFSIWELEDLLECDWEDENIILRSWYGKNEEIEHNLSEDFEIALSPYQDETYPEHKKHVDELFTCKDWYAFILKEIKIQMLTFILDSIKMDVQTNIINIEEEYRALK